MPYGPVALRLGMIATLLERWDEADRYFELAVELRSARARAVTARVLYEHAKMLVARGREEDHSAAASRLADAKRICQELDLLGVLQRVAAFAQSIPDQQPARHATAPGGPIPARGRVLGSAHSGECAQLRDTKGLRYVATLLAAPRREIHVMELVISRSWTHRTPRCRT